MEMIAFEESAMQGLLLELSEEIASADCAQMHQKIEDRIINSATLNEWKLKMTSLKKGGDMRQHSIPSSALNRCKRSFATKGPDAKIIYGCLGMTSQQEKSEDKKSTKLFKKKAALEVFIGFKDLESGKNVTCEEFGNVGARAIKLAYRLHQSGHSTTSIRAASGAIYTGVSH